MNYNFCKSYENILLIIDKINLVRDKLKTFIKNAKGSKNYFILIQHHIDFIKTVQQFHKITFDNINTILAQYNTIISQMMLHINSIQEMSTYSNKTKNEILADIKKLNIEINCNVDICNEYIKNKM